MKCKVIKVTHYTKDILVTIKQASFHRQQSYDKLKANTPSNIVLKLKVCGDDQSCDDLQDL
jgi:hypothetical protein